MVGFGLGDKGDVVSIDVRGVKVKGKESMVSNGRPRPGGVFECW